METLYVALAQSISIVAHGIWTVSNFARVVFMLGLFGTAPDSRILRSGAGAMSSLNIFGSVIWFILWSVNYLILYYKLRFQHWSELELCQTGRF
jgi:hypothetical protein